MSIQVIGKNIDIGGALRDRVSDRLEMAAGKYFDGGFSAHVAVEKVRSGFLTDCVIHLDTGISLQSKGEGDDAYQAFDRSAEKLETRLRRYKRRLKGHSAKASAEDAVAYIIAPPESDDDDEADGGDNPVIVAENPTRIPRLSVADAVMALDLGEAPAFVFRHGNSGRINVVYRRDDGHVGWVDPQESESSDA